MTENKIITELTPEQEALIPVYREKWRKIALSTERIDRKKAADAIKAAYTWFGAKQPEILFVDSPYAAFRQLDNIHYDYLDFSLRYDLRHPLINYANEKIHDSGTIEERSVLEQELLKLVLEVNGIIYPILEDDLWLEYICIPDGFIEGSVNVNLLIPECCYYDFCICVLNLAHNPKQWQVLKNVVQHCGWIIDYENICIVCDRPTKLSFDNENRLHAEAETAIEFADGFKGYAYHGVQLPEKYGKIHPEQWQAKWLLEEDNAELRRVLIQGIGYSRICQELEVIELNYWQEYTLLKIDSDVDIEPICLLTMVCPSTRYIHALRVPPNITSAREAIRWVNWGIDPEEFAVQT